MRAIGVFLLLIALVVLLGFWFGARPDAGTASDPPPPIVEQTNTAPRFAEAPVEPSDALAGALSCRDCHERFYRQWSLSRHGLAMQPYSAFFAARNLKPQKAAIRRGGADYEVRVAPNEGWLVERGPAGEKQRPLAHVLGGKNVYYFLTPGPRGRYQTLPLAYDVRRQEWFDLAASGVRHGSGGTTDGLRHWTDREYTFNTSCYRCHVSQIDSNYDPAADKYHTVWTAPGISCDSCHGPGDEHVQICEAAAKGAVPAELKIVSTRIFTAEQSNAMCAGCHARTVPITPGFKPGDRYFDHYDLVTLEDADFYPDGRDRGETFTYTLWRMSRCVQSGQMHCLHCHTSGGRFRFPDNPNRSCLPCHKDHVEQGTAHTHHPAESDGSSCIACHMPKTAFARTVRSDHSMRPPAPSATLAFQSPNACNLCHQDKDASWSDRWVRQWQTRDFQAPMLHRADLVESARQQDWSRLPDMLDLVTGPTRDEIYATSMIRLLQTCPDDRKWPVLVEALSDPSPLVRAAAAAALDGRESAEFRSGLLARTQDEFRLVRIRAAASLAGVDRNSFLAGDRKRVSAAVAEFETAMKARPDDYASHSNLGDFYMERGNYAQAVDAYETASKLQPREVAPLVSLSLALNAVGRRDRAEAALRKVLAVEPENDTALLNLGLLLGELGRGTDAENVFRQLFEVDPTSTVAAYNLSVLLSETQPQEAIEWARTAHDLAPDDPQYSYAYAYCLQEGGRLDEAVTALRRMIDGHPGFTDAYGLLGELLERMGQVEEAIAFYSNAATDERLSDAMREYLATRARLLSQR